MLRPNDEEGARRIVRELEIRLAEVENMVLRTPTGEVRNKLTDSAIHIRASINSLTEIL